MAEIETFEELPESVSKIRKGRPKSELTLTIQSLQPKQVAVFREVDLEKEKTFRHNFFRAKRGLPFQFKLEQDATTPSTFRVYCLEKV